MLINEIPDDCLLAIFDYINNLDDLINCYKVCIKWSNLIIKRTKKAKYLIDDRGYSFDTVYYPKPCLIESTWLIKLFTNLIIAELPFKFNLAVENVIEFVSKQESLRGLISCNLEPIERYCDNLEMLSVIYFNPNNLRNSSSIKQLDVRSYSLEELKRVAHYLPNLEKLKIQINGPNNPYDGPVLEKLKILEFSYFCYPENNYLGFQLMDSCPNLQSAHILMARDIWFFDETLKHKCLQDLVIDFSGIDDGNDTWNNLKRLLTKYPNLKHLALRWCGIITDTHIEQLVHILPNLVLLDVRKCYEVTQRAAVYIQDYCKRYGRLIKFYFDDNEHEIESDWPQSSIKHKSISRGFDFMKNCFFKNHVFLSRFLIPIDY
ncbi:uncharacterized protein LOC107369753 isoform X12 [Tetranychus urticae]|uniref:uncharacterized protein LOC107369753 isoform X12 n=1 Tax=Tetranychus urticae TaxID=32264 RepID=UPI000D64938D|nr:uncharacterized protein LOC107369753 isoform X12 [Tetranychus urticae]